MWKAIKQYFLPPERVRMPSEDREAYEEWLEEQSRLAETIDSLEETIEDLREYEREASKAATKEE